MAGRASFAFRGGERALRRGEGAVFRKKRIHRGRKRTTVKNPSADWGRLGWGGGGGGGGGGVGVGWWGGGVVVFLLGEGWVERWVLVGCRVGVVFPLWNSSLKNSHLKGRLPFLRKRSRQGAFTRRAFLL